MNGEEQEAVLGVLVRLGTRWVLPTPDADVWHAYDPLPFWLFLDGIRAATHLATGRRFLDVGCGIGDKLALMHHLGWQVAGIDRHPPYVDAARELVPEADVSCGDAMDADSFDADLVYMYRPAVADALEERLEAHVLERIRPGTVCFFPTRRVPEVWVA